MVTQESCTREKCRTATPLGWKPGLVGAMPVINGHILLSGRYFSPFFVISGSPLRYVGIFVLCHPPLQNGKMRRQKNNHSGMWLATSRHKTLWGGWEGQDYPTKSCFFGVGFPRQSCLGSLRPSPSHHLAMPGHFSYSNQEMLIRFRCGVGSHKSQPCSACQKASETQTYWDLKGFQWQKFDFSFL